VLWKICYYKPKTEIYTHGYPRYLSCLDFIKDRLEGEEDYNGMFVLYHRKTYTTPYEIVITRHKKIEFMKELKKLMKKVKE
jgi:hypothetical protein